MAPAADFVIDEAPTGAPSSSIAIEPAVVLDAGHVLIIDDHAALHEAEKRLLRRAGWLVSEASSGAQGVTMAARLLPDVIVCERRLPDIDGLTVISRLASDVSTSSIPVLLVTGTNDVNDLVAAIDAGAHAYLVRPFEHAEFEARCRAALRASRDVTDRLATAAALTESEATYRRIVDLAAEGIWVVDSGQVVTFANARMGELLGVPPEELVGRTPLEFMDEEGREANVGRIERRRAGMSEEGDFKFIRRDGTVVWTSLNAAPILDDEGVYRGSIALVSDVSDRHHQEVALARSEARYRALLDRLPDAIAIVYDRDLRVVMAAGAGLEQRGFDPATMVGRHFDDLVVPDDALILRPICAAALDGKSTTLEFLSGRTQVDNLLDIVPVSIASDGATEEILLLARDIGPIKDRERALEAAEARWRAAFDAAPVGMAQIAVSGRFMRVNRALCDLLGYTPEEFATKTPADLTHPDDVSTTRRAMNALGRGTLARYRVEKRFLHANGDVVWTVVNAVPVVDQGGDVDHTLVHYLDITGFKRVEAELQRLSVQDPLTGLLNRRGFETELERHDARITRYGPTGALLVIDLDGLKAINDAGGHEAGDAALIAVTDVLRRRMRTTDAIARLGGDEFAVLLPHADILAASRVASSLVNLIRGRGLGGAGASRNLRASVGVVVFANSSSSGVDLLIDADRAMYSAKLAGGDRYAVAVDGDVR